jgi:hypothetical protein
MRCSKFSAAISTTSSMHKHYGSHQGNRLSSGMTKDGASWTSSCATGASIYSRSVS